MLNSSGEGPRKNFLGCGYDMESGARWDAQLRRAAECGFTYWELAVGTKADQDRGWLTASDSVQLEELKNSLKIKPVGAVIDQDWGLELESEGDFESRLDVLAELMESAVKLGARRISVQPPRVAFEAMTESMWSRFLGGWSRLAAVAESGKAKALLPTAGFKTPVEGHPGVWDFHPTFMIHPDGLERVIHSLEDLLWLEYSPGDIKPFWPKEKFFWSDLLYPWVDSCRLSDRKWVSMDHRHWMSVALGDDFLEFGPILRHLKLSGICWVQPVSVPDPDEGMFRNIEYVKNLEENFLEFYFARQ